MVLSIPVHNIFLNFDFPFDVQNSNALCHTEQIFEVWWDILRWRTQVMQDMPLAHTHPHIYSSTRTQDHVITDLLTVISATSAFSTVGKQMLSDNRQLSNTATVRGHTHGPIRTPPSFRCCLNDTGYHVKGHLTHTVYKHAWDLFHHSS